MARNGNETTNSSILDVLLALKQNVFRTMNVADLCVVREIKGDFVRCEYLTTGGMFIEAVPSVGLELAAGDVVLVVFTTNNFKTSLSTYKSGKPIVSTTSITYHDVTCGVIVSIVYKK